MSFLVRLRNRARRFARSRAWLYTVVRTLKYGPFMGFRRRSGARRALVAKGHRDGRRMLNLGSGGRRLPGVINLDVTPVTGPQVVGDGYALPFADGAFHAIFCEYVIEHVPDPEAFLRAVSRTLEPGGRFYLEVPFLQPAHDLPSDYTRWTRNGFQRGLERAGLHVEQSGVHLGPAFTLFWISKDLLASLFSFGSDRVYRVLRYLFSWLLAPLPFLDILLLRLPQAETLASGYYFVAVPVRRPTVTEESTSRRHDRRVTFAPPPLSGVSHA